MAANGDATDKMLLANRETHVEGLDAIKLGQRLNLGHIRWD
jgi:hypothetical protein